MNWVHKEVKLGWIGLVENVSRKWVSTQVNYFACPPNKIGLVFDLDLISLLGWIFFFFFFLVQIELGFIFWKAEQHKLCNQLLLQSKQIGNCLFPPQKKKEQSS